MTEFLDFLKQIAPLVTSILVPVVGLALKIARDRQDPGIVRSMKRHTAILDTLPESAKPAMVDLITKEVEKYTEGVLRRSARKLDGAALVTLILVGVVTGFGLYWLLIAGGFWWPAYIGAVVWGLLGLALIIAGLGQLFYYGDKPARKSKEPATA